MPILSEEDLERFRTKVCTLASSMKCDFGVERCNYSHNLYWARRCPFYLRDSSILRYIPHCCPDVELGEGTTVLRNSCPRGNNCSFAHSFEEIHYHPLVYKTEVCKDYRLGKCKTYYCHLVHGLAEYRVPKEYVLPKKVGLDIPAFAHVKMVDNIRSINTGNVSVGCFQKSKLNAHQDRTGRAETKGKRDHRSSSLEGPETCNLKSWSSIKWRNKGPEKDQLTNNLSTSISSNNSRENKVDRGDDALKRSNSIESVERSEESIYDWSKLISMPKIDYTDGDVGLGDDKNYSILKLYDKHLGGYDFTQLNIYGSEMNGYNGQFDTELNSYGFENDNRNDSLVRRNVNMWNEASTKKIIESSDNALGTVSSIMDDTYQNYEVFKASDLGSSLDSSRDDICSSISNQCELIKRNSKEFIRDNINWDRVVEECKKLLEMAVEANELAKGKVPQE